ncbi:MAG: hypothetical protein MZW92_30725 [Comamonadaceae bacterium]|nr:hypothetical protein [Comamonadaceae bacterium]
MASFGAMAQKPAVDKAQQTTGEMSPPQKADEGAVKKAEARPEHDDRVPSRRRKRWRRRSPEPDDAPASAAPTRRWTPVSARR